MSWAVAAVPHGEQDCKASLQANGSEQEQTHAVETHPHSMYVDVVVNARGINKFPQIEYKEAAEEKEV